MEFDQRTLSAISSNMNAKSQTDELWFKVGYHTATDEYSVVETLLQEIIRINPFDAGAHMHLGLRLRDRDDIKTALMFLGCAVELEEENSEAAFNYGTCLAINGEHEKALSWLKHAIEISPENTDYVYNLGINYLELHEIEKAMECFEKVLNKDPNHIIARYNIGLNHKLNDRMSEAKECFLTIVGQTNQFIPALQQLTRIGLKRKDIKLARGIAKEALEANPNNLELILDEMALAQIDKDYDAVSKRVKEIGLLIPDWKSRLEKRIGNLLCELK